jgi:predicted MPP superfamily phosphohydrolase
MLTAGTIAVGLAEVVAVPIARRAAIHLAIWPATAPPIRVALLSDIHVGNRAMKAARFKAIVDQVNAARPDLVLLAGDFVIGHSGDDVSAYARALTAPLRRLRAPLGVIAVLGNHDHWTDPGAVRAALTAGGVVVMENEAVRRGPITVIGVGDLFSGHDDWPRSMQSAAKLGGMPLVVTHSPDLATRLPKGFPLLLAGHTHCGQIVLPVLGPLIAYSPLLNWQPLYDPKYRCGIIRDPGRITVVTAGVGSGTAPIRIGAPPDWWLLTLGR